MKKDVIITIGVTVAALLSAVGLLNISKESMQTVNKLQSEIFTEYASDSEKNLSINEYTGKKPNIEIEVKDINTGEIKEKKYTLSYTDSNIGILKHLSNKEDIDYPDGGTYKYQ